MFDERHDRMSRGFALVQRMHVADRPAKTGLDALFRLAYMGSTEYECGEAFRSLWRIRAAGDLQVRTADLDGRAVHFVGPATVLDEYVDLWRDWVAEGARSRDGARFTAALAGEDYVPDAWWALCGDLMWTLDEGVAQRLLEGITPAPVAAV